MHPLGVEKVHKSIASYWDNPMAHPVWTVQEVNSVARTHKKPSNLTDYTALAAVRLCKFVFDSITFFKWGTLTEHGWIHALLEEAENERMHLLTFLKLRRPGLIFRLSVIFTQVKQG